MSASTPMPVLRVAVENDRTTASFATLTHITEENAEAVGRAFEALASARTTPELVLDLGAIEFLSSVGLTQLLRLGKDVRAGGGRFVIANPRPDVRHVFAVTRLDRLLELEPATRTLVS